GARLVDRTAARPEGDRHADGVVPPVTLRHPVGPAGTVQLELLQGGPLQTPEIACRGGGGQSALRGGLRTAETRLWRSLDAACLHGAGPAQSSERGGMAHGPGVDQQWLTDGSLQLRGRTGR